MVPLIHHLFMSYCMFCYAWELYWDFVSPTSSSSAVWKASSGFLCVPDFGACLQGHLVEKEKRELKLNRFYPAGLKCNMIKKWIKYHFFFFFFFTEATESCRLGTELTVLGRENTNMVYLSNPNLPLPSRNALLQPLVFVFDTHVLIDIRSLIICHLASQVFVKSFCLQTLLRKEKIK